ncbi:hypothetical protein SLEP1_g42779 [Rubroshorea leprosula]|uniref:Uncharacterized protein n=1 Tax=Rubroshorea leprosula TaxID=152421 RepID=A0AAV5LBW1_9ROSI|nr:hypothetical protein SLEP1_g42779 [Rubroshorea leprosula]
MEEERGFVSFISLPSIKFFFSNKKKGFHPSVSPLFPPTSSIQTKCKVFSSSFHCEKKRGKGR